MKKLLVVFLALLVCLIWTQEASAHRQPVNYASAWSALEISVRGIPGLSVGTFRPAARMNVYANTPHTWAIRLSANFVGGPGPTPYLCVGTVYQTHGMSTVPSNTVCTWWP
jgi:hypothetical protein